MIQPYTKEDLERGEKVVRALHGLKGFEAWAERIAKEIALARSSGREGWKLVPVEPTEEMIEKGLGATAAWLDIVGSQATVNREKMRRRYQAMVAAAPTAEDKK